MRDWNAIIKGMTQEELGALASAVEQAAFDRHHEESLGAEIVKQAQRQSRQGPLSRDPGQRLQPTVEALGTLGTPKAHQPDGEAVDPVALIRKLLQAPGEHHRGVGMRAQQNLTGIYPDESTVDAYRANPLASPWQPGEMRQTVREIRSRKP